MGGCSSGRKKPEADKPAKPTEEKKTEFQKIGTGAGELTRYSPDDDHKILWKIRWDSVDLEISEKGQASGAMQKVQGTIYRSGEPVSSFSAERGFAPKDSKDLRLEGSIQVDSLRPSDPKKARQFKAAALRCSFVIWRPDFNRIEAKGNVRLDLPPWQMGVLPELWATPDLKEAGTPDLFGKDGHGRSR